MRKIIERAVAGAGRLSLADRHRSNLADFWQMRLNLGAAAFVLGRQQQVRA